MTDRGTTVSAELGLMLVVPRHATVPLAASLLYTSDDPYALRMAFHVGTDEPVEWIFARDLLAAGMTALSGEGDVQAWPSAEDGQAGLHIVLSSPFGRAHFVAPRAAIAEFLRRSYEAIPAGREGDYLDIAGELDGLLWQA
jgi:hypothetical protein